MNKLIAGISLVGICLIVWGCADRWFNNGADGADAFWAATFLVGLVGIGFLLASIVPFLFRHRPG